MTPVDIVILSVLGVAVLGIIGYLIYKKATGKGGCDCGCSGCSSCPNAKNCGGNNSEN